ncbi:peptidoglycan DD-metalloendopeptidase family protein [Bacillus sp. REN3]|uniref:peptidoglycan DD-metalloendopeptidase family protein n=1 Tax=Bacillus sp. REN3 TaxID=2802440 RepID=UPI001AED9104|nr:peptidoglycan DD-metalloendopeptidase family protein [Bacillus sp. REN3]
MHDFIKRLLIAGLMALCISLLFLGGKHSQAEMLDIEELTSKWVWPAEGVVTDLYGTRNGEHKGIDIASTALTPIHTVDKGIVTKSYYSNSYGHVIFIKHDNNLETVYAHLNKRLVKEGAIVQRGEIIGEMGNTGDSSGVHLHFEIHQNEWTFEKENAINPEKALGHALIGQPVFVRVNQDANESVETIAKLSVNDGTEDRSLSMKNGQSKKNPTEEKEERVQSSAQNQQTHSQSHLRTNKDNQLLDRPKLASEGNANNKYTVSTGDTLYSIAKKTNTSVDALKQLNRLTSDVIKPQQILITQ